MQLLLVSGHVNTPIWYAPNWELLIYKEEYANTVISGMNIFANGTTQNRHNKCAVYIWGIWRRRANQEKRGRFVLGRNRIEAHLTAVSYNDHDDDDDDRTKCLFRDHLPVCMSLSTFKIWSNVSILMKFGIEDFSHW